MKLYSIRDKKLASFNAPFASESEVQATRQFGVVARDNTTQLSYYPDDFDLYEVGSFDINSGKLETIEPRFIIGAVSFRKMEEKI